MMSSVISFTYKREGKAPSPRVLYTISRPTDKYFGIDLSELDIEEQGQFIGEMDLLNAKRNKDVAELMAKYDIVHKFRYFFPENMVDLTVDN